MVVDEANVDFGAETAIPLISTYPNLLVVQTCRSREPWPACVSATRSVMLG